MNPAARQTRREGRTKRELRWGFSTGTAASAAAKAALTALLTGRELREVETTLPDGSVLTIALDLVSLAGPGLARAEVVKDGGDDPDATHRARIVAEVELDPEGEGLELVGGPGVGRVTRPGLPVEVGGPAINPVPRRMILLALAEAWAAAGRQGAPRGRVTISVPRGEEIARHTLNPRLGILGGISILGTHGRVKPFSHEAYLATIDSALAVAREAGSAEVVLTTGGKSEKRAMNLRPDLPEPAFVQMADLFAHALGKAGEEGFSRVGLVSFFGKAVKQAMSLACTHAHRAPMDLTRLAGWLGEAGAPEELTGEVAGANTARHALEILSRQGREDLVSEVGHRLLEAARDFLGPEPELWVVILGYGDEVLFEGREPGGRS